MASDQTNINEDGLSVERVASDPVVKRPVSRTEVRQMMEVAADKLADKLNARVAQVTEDF